MRRNRQMQFTAAKLQMLGRRHGARSAKLLDLFLCQVAWRSAHRVESFEDVGMVVVHAPDLNSGGRGNILDVDIEDLIGTSWASGHCVFCARPGGWGIVPQRQCEAVRRYRGERGGRVDSYASTAELVQ